MRGVDQGAVLDFHTQPLHPLFLSFQRRDVSGELLCSAGKMKMQIPRSSLQLDKQPVIWSLFSFFDLGHFSSLY